jgi:hypothetical protein
MVTGGLCVVGGALWTVPVTPGFPFATIPAGGAAELGANFDTSHRASEYGPPPLECRRNSAAGVCGRARSANLIAPARCIQRCLCSKSWHIYLTHVLSSKNWRKPRWTQQKRVGSLIGNKNSECRTCNRTGQPKRTRCCGQVHMYLGTSSDN